MVNKMMSNSTGLITSYRRISNYYRLSTQGEITQLYNERLLTEPIDPNILFDINFNNSLDIDHTIDGSALIFEADDPARITEDDGFVTVRSGFIPTANG